MEFHNPQLLPLIPEGVRRAHHVHEPYDTRFRAAARMLQALWRESRALPAGRHVSESGAVRRLGSKLATDAARSRRQLPQPRVFGLARCDLAYREPGALIDAERLWSNLLSSMPLAYNLLAPLKADKALGAARLPRLLPGQVKAVAHLQFEHSPGRGDPTFTADGTAFDAFLATRDGDRRKSFIAIEVKYSESMTEPAARLRPRYDELSRAQRPLPRRRRPRSAATRCNSSGASTCSPQAMVDSQLYDHGMLRPDRAAPKPRGPNRRPPLRGSPRPDAAKVPFIRLDLEDVHRRRYRQGRARPTTPPRSTSATPTSRRFINWSAPPASPRPAGRARDQAAGRKRGRKGQRQTAVEGVTARRNGLLDIKSLGHAPQHSGEQFLGVQSQRAGDRHELHQIETAIAVLDFADKLLRLAEARGQLHLRHARAFAGGDQGLAKGIIRGGKQ